MLYIWDELSPHTILETERQLLDSENLALDLTLWRTNDAGVTIRYNTHYDWFLDCEAQSFTEAHTKFLSFYAFIAHYTSALDPPKAGARPTTLTIDDLLA